MNAEQREEAVFEAALRLSAAERASYLERACAGDVELRRRVEALLGAFERAGGFMKEAATPERTAHSSLQPTEKPGDRIGRYKLLEQIGEGGCGVVYVAEQEEPVRRRVALKIIKLGMDTKQVVARFDAERQALAMMDHPNIAKIHDAGATDTGRPYFAMELVKGIRITDYCEQNQLSPRERLDLFIQVCRAIQHAHQKGVIHRDIKPSNILVTSDDGVPVPKVIDFGIAKATQGRLTDQTIYTAFEQFIGTPAYMSPEQAQLSMQDIDTRSDIYSLGVLLYELLTGATPFDAKELLSRGLDAMRRTIREVEPLKPSTRITQDLVAADVRRLQLKPPTPDQKPEDKARASSRRLLQEVKGDLDWIVMKCLEKDRVRRYETANGLATDIQRHLNNETIVARPPSKLYEFRKTVERHKFGFAATTAVILALTVGLGISTRMYWQAQAEKKNAEAEKKRAQTESARSAEVAHFMKDMLAGVGPLAAGGRDTSLLRDIMDRTMERVSRDLANQPEVEAELRMTVGAVYNGLGEYGKAEATLRKAVELRMQLFGETNASTATAMYELADVLKQEYKTEESELLLRRVIAIRKHLFGPDSITMTAAYWGLANNLSTHGGTKEAEELLREGLRIQKKAEGDESASVATTLLTLGDLLRGAGRHAESEPMLREGLRIRIKRLGEESSYTGIAYSFVGKDLEDQRKYEEAEFMFRKALAANAKLGTNSFPLYYGIALYHLARVLDGKGASDEAETTYRQALAVRRKAFGNEHLYTTSIMWDLATFLRKKGDLAEAESLFRECLQADRKRHARKPVNAVTTMMALADVLALEGKQTEATPLYQEILEILSREGQQGNINALNRMAWVLATCADPATRDGRKAVSLATKAVEATHRQKPAMLDTLAAAYAETGDFTNAVAVQTEAIALLNDEKSKADYGSRLKFYTAGAPYRASKP